MTSNIDLQDMIQIITKDRINEMSFDEIINGFPSKYEKLINTNPIINVNQYFGPSKGMQYSKEKLLRDKLIKRRWIRKYETKEGKIKDDFKGVYVFFHKERPFYVGISKGVIGRIQQHVKGRNHFTSTLAYKIGCIFFGRKNGFEYNGKRRELKFEEYVEPAKEFVRGQSISFMHIENNDELALFEIYCSMRLKTYLNSFETH